MQNSTNTINETIQDTLKNISQLVDVNTIIGSPLDTKNGEIIIPVTKVTMGILCGGGEYGKVTIFNNGKDLPKTLGNANVVSIKPCGFLIKNNDDSNYVFLPTNQTSYEKIFDKTSDLLSKLSNGEI